MKLCITANGNSLEAPIDGSFGRAPWLLVIETENRAVLDAIENSGVNASQGAGIAASQTIVDKGAEALLTGRVGPKAQAALQAAGVKIYENISGGTVREALEQFLEGKYQEATGADTAKGGGGGGGQCRGGGQGGGRGRGRGMGQGQGRRGGI